jgi:hypothetical protein
MTTAPDRCRSMERVGNHRATTGQDSYARRSHIARLSRCEFSPYALLVLVLVAPLWGQDAPQDNCANLDSTLPIVCLSVPNDKLTVERRSGKMSIYASIFASAAVIGPVRITIMASLIANPSGVKLDEGGSGTVKDFQIDASHPLKDQLLLTVRTSSDNPTSGHLVYYLELRNDGGVKVQGSPQRVAVETNP